MKNTITQALVFLLVTSLILGCNQSSTKKAKVITDVDVPQWAKQVVWYQIFPERFRNGDPSNDPTYEDIQGAWPHDTISPWELHSWSSDWYELQPYELENGNDIWYNITRRRYGGDLQGIIDKLDYLKRIGIGAIYLNPVFMAPSHHKYDAFCYHHIDPTFGPDTKGDKALMKTETPDNPDTWVWTSADSLMLKLIKEIHARDMKIILDGVFNHLGITSFAFQDLLRNQQTSRFKEWFIVNSWDNPEAGTSFDYEGWWGVKDLPVLREDDKGIVSGPKEYIFAATSRWMDPNGDGSIEKGIDGWRLDVASEVGIPFWKEWRKMVKSINPEAYLTGEIIDSTEKLIPYLTGDAFDAVMNYNFMFICNEFFIKDKFQCPTSKFDIMLAEHREPFPTDVNLAMQNLLGSHDTDRPGSRVMNKRIASFIDINHYFNKSTARNPWYRNNRTGREDINILKLMVIFQMTYLGSPMIYYGDEVGMWGAKDPCDRKPMIWEDITFENAAYRPDGKRWKFPDNVNVNRFLFNHYKKLINIRNSNKALQLGDFKTLFFDDQNEIYAFSRNYKNQSIIVILNNHPRSRHVEFDIGMDGQFIDILNDNEEYATTDQKINLRINPKWAVILKKE